MKISRKERWLRVLDGREADRLVFWPKIFNDSYAAAQVEPFKSMSIRDIHDYAGTDIQQMLPSCVCFRYKTCELIEEKQDGLLINHYRTPIGDLKGILRYDRATDSYQIGRAHV